jgi:hypothetical protein
MKTCAGGGSLAVTLADEQRALGIIQKLARMITPRSRRDEPPPDQFGGQRISFQRSASARSNIQLLLVKHQSVGTWFFSPLERG